MINVAALSVSVLSCVVTFVVVIVLFLKFPVLSAMFAISALIIIIAAMVMATEVTPSSETFVWEPILVYSLFATSVVLMLLVSLMTLVPLFKNVETNLERLRTANLAISSISTLLCVSATSVAFRDNVTQKQTTH
jgi:hypothetical protein